MISDDCLYKIQGMSTRNKYARPRKRWLLYILRCNDGTLYTGITNDLSRRLVQHHDGNASRYTRSRRPLKLVYQEPCRDKSSALRKEYAVKQLSKKDKQEYIKRKSKLLDYR